LHTLQGCLTPPYAAPEQWRSEHTTTATDIYALGCIGYFLLTGNPPFQGHSEAEFRQQHLSGTPPHLEGNCPQLTSLLAMMLRKAQEARPNLKRVIDNLMEIAKNPDSGKLDKGFGSLASVGAEMATQQAKKEAEQQAIKAEQERRKAIAAEAEKIFIGMRKELFEKICRVASVATYTRDEITLGNASMYIKLLYSNQELANVKAFRRSNWDVLSAAIIRVIQKEPQYQWSASLWYSKLPGELEYRWREVSYYVDPLRAKLHLHYMYQPFGLEDLNEADLATSPTYGSIYRIAFGPEIIDDECFDVFCSRWVELFATAVKGQLRKPRLPLK
ncbi:MAG: protein kinase, partial [Sedimentisphaerales bacterium]